MYLLEKLLDELRQAAVPEPQLRYDLDGLIDWLQTQDPETAYDWWDYGGCMLARFHEACHGTRMYVHSPMMSGIGFAEPWTYGAALARAKQRRAVFGA